LKVTYFTAR